MLALLRPAHRVISSKFVVPDVSHEKIGNRAATAVTATVASLAVLVISFLSMTR